MKPENEGVSPKENSGCSGEALHKNFPFAWLTSDFVLGENFNVKILNLAVVFIAARPN